MRRKIACYVTGAVTALFMALRVVAVLYPEMSFGTFSLEDGMIGVALAAMLVVAVLCFSKSSVPVSVHGTVRPFGGWCATFCGALLIMSVILDTFCWAIYGQVPPPGEYVLNNVDRYTLICSLIFGVTSGVFLIVQGFNWMAGSTQSKRGLSWLSLAPVLWMWFRLARYEISYASTIDISHSFFEVAALVTASLFFLQLARAVTGVGTQPKNSLITLALFTSICTFSGAPLTFYRLSIGAPINSLLIALVDATVGLLAFIIALAQLSSTSVEETTAENDELAWTTPQKVRQPLDPPFSVDRKLPFVDEPLQEEEDSDEEDGEELILSVEAILEELDKEV